MSAISSRGSKAPNTVVPEVAQTRNGAAPCEKEPHTKRTVTIIATFVLNMLIDIKGYAPRELHVLFGSLIQWVLLNFPNMWPPVMTNRLRKLKKCYDIVRFCSIFFL
jgi:hypothetical protein